MKRRFPLGCAAALGPALKVPVGVENGPGASNTLAADIASNSNDGHTLVMGCSAPALMDVMTPMTQAQFASFHEAENKRYAELIKRRGIKVE